MKEELKLNHAEDLAFNVMVRMSKIEIIMFFLNESRARQRAYEFINSESLMFKFTNYLKRM